MVAGLKVGMFVCGGGGFGPRGVGKAVCIEVRF